MKLPTPTNTIQVLIDKAHEEKAEQPRGHLGASSLGQPCDRWLWLNFRWAVQQKFPGRILRLFRRGQMEEATIISDLQLIGINVRKMKTQLRVDFGSHVSGSLDAIIDGGVPEAPKAKHIAEFKTHSLKSFNDLDKQGVEKSKPEHFVQMQVYMAGTGIDRALYVAVCKDDDRIYTERIHYDKEVATKAIERGQRIALTDRMPEPVSADPTWYACKWCPAHDLCHVSHITKHVNCRTCAHATPLSDSTWHCAKWDGVIPLDAQYAGCESHVLHPDLVPWPRKEGEEGVAIYVIDGKDVRNGAPGVGVYSSKELLANPKACAGADPELMKMREQFDGRVVG